ncbi:hypothetical protein LCGC14_1287860 [marine sediment metagenome]|uniref:Transglycosylase SLT domain-containing protein n=1 Tax=marine sediment metagenome TaxID=412755 RepID=A0A0F9N9Z3_9ZZZZ
MTDTLLAVYGIENTSAAFQRGVLDMTGRIGGNPDYWMAVMSFETGGSFRASQPNMAGGDAIGLIQFTKGARDLVGKTRAELGAMTAVEQLVYVEKYLAPASGKFVTLSDHYMAVLAPIGMGKSQDFVIYRADALTARGRRHFQANSNLDLNDNDEITVGEATTPVANIVDNATSRIEVPDEHPPGPSDAAAPVIGGIIGLLLFILGIRKFKRLGRLKS